MCDSQRIFIQFQNLNPPASHSSALKIILNSYLSYLNLLVWNAFCYLRKSIKVECIYWCKVNFRSDEQTQVPKHSFVCLFVHWFYSSDTFGSNFRCSELQHALEYLEWCQIKCISISIEWIPENALKSHLLMMNISFQQENPFECI